jgi:molecular chaperone HtpG
MSALGGGLNFYGQMPDSYNVVLNFENPLIQKIVEAKEAQTKSVTDELNAKRDQLQISIDQLAQKNKDKKYDEIPAADKDEKERLNQELESVDFQSRDAMKRFAGNNTLVKQLTDLALLSNNMLKGKELHSFIKRSLEILK